MKTLLSLLVMICGLALAAQTSTKPVIFYWDKPSTLDIDTVWNLYWTTNITTPSNQWPLFVTITSPSNYSATQLSFNTNLVPGQYFFTLTATNTFWHLESFFSAAASTPPVLPQSQLSGFAIRAP